RTRLQRPAPCCLTDTLPIVGERLARAITTANRQPVCKGRGIHRAGAGRTQSLEGQSLFIQQPIEHTPSEGAMRSTSLKRKVDLPDMVGGWLKPVPGVPLRARIHGSPRHPVCFATVVSLEVK